MPESLEFGDFMMGRVRERKDTKMPARFGGWATGRTLARLGEGGWKQSGFGSSPERWRFRNRFHIRETGINAKNPEI